MKVVVIIPAAGLGTRMTSVSDAKSKKPAASKQFFEIGGTPCGIPAGPQPIADGPARQPHPLAGRGKAGGERFDRLGLWTA